MLRFAYNTIGCANHRLDDALELIAEAGYQGVVLTLDVHHMNPFADGWEAVAEALKARLEAADLAVTVDTGSRFLLDPRDRLQPTLLSATEEARAERIDYLGRAIKVCKILGGEAVVFTAGRAKRNVSQANAGVWLLDGLKQVADMAAEAGVTAALEPEPGHIVGSLDDFTLVRETLKQMTDAPLRLAVDAGHVMMSGERAPHQAVKEFAPVLSAVAVADMRQGVHAHLPLGEGDLDVTSVLAALRQASYDGLVSVKLPRDSYRADDLIPRSIDWLIENVPSD
ncbi:MAG: sugar phosphate isomerase/epimerase family protein [Pseudomonadota bacterium]